MKKGIALIILFAACLFFTFSCSKRPSVEQNASFCSSETQSEELGSQTQVSSEEQFEPLTSQTDSQEQPSAQDSSKEQVSHDSATSSIIRPESQAQSSSQNSSSENTVSDTTASKNEVSSSPSSSSSQPSGEAISSQTQSSEVIRNTDLNTIGIGAYHFNPIFAHNYVTEDATDWQLRYSSKFDNLRYQELEDVLKAGYFNTIIVSVKTFNDQRLWEICEKYEVTVWFHNDKHYNSDKTSIEKYIEEIDDKLSTVKSNPKWWSIFAGFTFEEPFWMGKQSNNEFLAETEALYKKYAKRLMPMFAVYEFTSYENGNTNIDMDDKQILKINPKSTKYLTDIGFDSYDVDVRAGAPNGNRYAYWQSILPNNPYIYDGDSYYTEYISELLKLVDHDVNVWFHPSASTRNIWGGLNGLKTADEDFCLSHLEYFREKLQEQKYKGGLILYNYKQFKDGVQTLERLLVLNDPQGNPKMYPEIKKWQRYSQRLKEITSEFKGTTNNKLARLG